jgi:hypothetical protein
MTWVKSLQYNCYLYVKKKLADRRNPIRSEFSKVNESGFKKNQKKMYGIFVENQISQILVIINLSVYGIQIVDRDSMIRINS